MVVYRFTRFHRRSKIRIANRVQLSKNKITDTILTRYRNRRKAYLLQICTARCKVAATRS